MDRPGLAVILVKTISFIKEVCQPGRGNVSIVNSVLQELAVYLI